jgi:acyl carrier protein
MTSNEGRTISKVRWQDLAAHIRNEILLDTTLSIVETTPLISSGLLDSYSVAELITHMEDRFDVKVAPRWHRLEHLDSLERIVRTIETIRREQRSNET